MLPYFILLSAVLLFSKPSYLGKKSSWVYLLPLIISTFILVLYAGLRSSDIGTDTNNYVGIYRKFNNFNGSIFEMNTSIEIGYLFLQKLALLLSSQYWALLLTVACFAVIPYVILIKKLSLNVRLSYFLYITLAIYIVAFNAGRQGIAAAIASISVLFLIKKSFLKYFICILIATLFHNTAIILLPFYFILNRKITIKSTLLYICIGILSFSYLSTILSVFSDDVEARYAVYEDRGAAGGYLLAFFFITISVFLYVLRSKISSKNSKYYDIFLNYCLFTAIIYIVVLITNADVNFIRLTNYFAIGFIFIWPIIFKDVKIFKHSIMKFLFVLIHLSFFFIYLNRMADLVPYKFNPNLF